jgi:hypothetical protein
MFATITNREGKGVALACLFTCITLFLNPYFKLTDDCFSNPRICGENWQLKIW